MTKEELAKQLDGSEYPLTISKDLKAAAKAAGLVIVYGASDDLMEFDGAIYDEVGANEGTTAKIDREGIFPEWDDFRHTEEDEEEFQKYFSRKPNVKAITAVWDRDGYSFVYDTEIPHVTFNVLEDGEKYCRGIVFALADL